MRYSIKLFIISLLAICSCKDEGTPPPPARIPTVQLALEEAGVTEVWLRLKFIDSREPRGFRLRRDASTLLSGVVVGGDTVLVDTLTAPGQTYTYTALRFNGTAPVDSSTSLQVATLDSTSHNWSFSFDTLGDASSILYDVAIVSDTLVYVVGEVYKRGPIVDTLYNVGKWNRSAWQLLSVQFLTFCNQPGMGSYPARSIFAFNEQDVWLSSGSQIVRWTGGSQTPPVCIPVSVNRLWGVAPNQSYAVGAGGSIAYFDGLTWQSVPSGTTADMRDVWGYAGSNNGGRTTLGIASSPGETKILSLATTGARDTLSWPVAQRLRGIWMSNRFTVYVSGPGIWRNIGSGWRQMAGSPQTQFLTGVRGTKENNIFTVAWRGVLAHFNSVSWHQFAEIPADFNFEAVAVSENLMVAVGFTGGLSADKAAVVIGRRVP